MELIKKHGYDENSAPPTNYIWHKGGKVFKFTNGKGMEDSGSDSTLPKVSSITANGVEYHYRYTDSDGHVNGGNEVGTAKRNPKIGDLVQVTIYSPYAESGIEVSYEITSVKYDTTDGSKEYFTIIPHHSGTIYFGHWGYNKSTQDGTKTIQYRLNGGEGKEITSEPSSAYSVGPTLGAPIEVEAWDIVQFKGNNERYADIIYDKDGSKWINGGNGFFVDNSMQISVAGNIMSLCNGDNFSINDQISESAFSSLFATLSSAYNNGVVDASNLVLPKTLADQCYANMFANNTNLREGPTIPNAAYTGGGLFYERMFSGCSHLTKVTCLMDGTKEVFPEYVDWFSNWLPDTPRGVLYSARAIDDFPTDWTVQLVDV